MRIKGNDDAESGFPALQCSRLLRLCRWRSLVATAGRQDGYARSTELSDEKGVLALRLATLRARHNRFSGRPVWLQRSPLVGVRLVVFN